MLLVLVSLPLLLVLTSTVFVAVVAVIWVALMIGTLMRRLRRGIGVVVF